MRYCILLGFFVTCRTTKSERNARAAEQCQQHVIVGNSRAAKPLQRRSIIHSRRATHSICFMLKEDFQVSRIIGSNLQVYDLGNKEARPTLSLIFFYLRFFFFLLLANGLFLLFSANLAALALLYILWLFRSLSLLLSRAQEIACSHSSRRY